MLQNAEVKDILKNKMVDSNVVAQYVLELITKFKGADEALVKLKSIKSGFDGLAESVKRSTASSNNAKSSIESLSKSILTLDQQNKRATGSTYKILQEQGKLGKGIFFTVVQSKKYNNALLSQKKYAIATANSIKYLSKQQYDLQKNLTGITKVSSNKVISSMSRDWKTVSASMNENGIITRKTQVMEVNLDGSLVKLKQTLVNVNGEWKRLTPAIQEQINAQKRLQGELAKSGQQWRTASVQTNKHGEIVGRTITKYKQITTNLGTEVVQITKFQKKIGDGWKDVTYKMDPAGKLNSVLQQFTKFRWALVNFAMAMGVAVSTYRFLLKPTVEFESKLAGVRRTTSLAKEQIIELGYSLRELSKEMPISLLDLTNIARVAGQIGVGADEKNMKVRLEKIKSFVSTISLFSIATGMDAEKASTTLGKLAAAFNQPIEKVALMSSAIAKLGIETAATAEEISDSLIRVAPAAASLGITEETMIGLQSTVLNAGVRASRAGTRMRNALSGISVDMKKFADTARYTFKEFSDMMNEDVDAAFLKLLKSLYDNYSGVERLKEINRLFGKVAASVITIAVNNYDDLIKNIKLANLETKTGLSVVEQYGAEIDSLKNKWLILGNVIKAAISKPEGFPFFKGVLERGTAIFEFSKKERKEFFKTHPEAESELKKYQFRMIPFKYNWFTGPTINTHSRLMQTEIMYKTYIKEYKEEINKLSDELNLEPENKKLLQASMLRFSSEYGIQDQYRIFKKLLDNMKSAVEIQNTLSDTSNKNINVYSSLTEASQDYINKMKELNSVEVSNIEVRSVILQQLEDIKDEIKEQFGDQSLEAVLEFATAFDITKEKISSLVPTTSNVGKEIDVLLSKMKDKVSSLKEKYDEYKDAMFSGEQQQLDALKTLQWKIKEQELAQLKLKNSVEETNDSLSSEEDSYKAWVETVHEAIRAILVEGNDLSKNVSSLILEQQTKLLSTSKFDYDEELSSLDKLKREQEIMQLEYELNYGRKHEMIDDYISKKEREGQIEWETVEQAKSAIGTAYNNLESYSSTVENLEGDWNKVKTAVGSYVENADNVLSTLNSSIDNQATKVRNLINLYKNLNKDTNKEENFNTPVSLKDFIKVKEKLYSEWKPTSSINLSSLKEYINTNEKTYSEWKPTPRKSLSSFLGFSSSRTSLIDKTLGLFADGGIVTRPTMGIIGEKGPEAVIPLNGSSNPVGNNIVIQNLNLNGISGDPEEFALQFAEIVNRQIKTQ